MDLAQPIFLHNMKHFSMVCPNRAVIPLSTWPQDSLQLFQLNKWL